MGLEHLRKEHLTVFIPIIFRYCDLKYINGARDIVASTRPVSFYVPKTSGSVGRSRGTISTSEPSSLTRSLSLIVDLSKISIPQYRQRPIPVLPECLHCLQPASH